MGDLDWMSVVVDVVLVVVAEEEATPATQSAVRRMRILEFMMVASDLDCEIKQSSMTKIHYFFCVIDNNHHIMWVDFFSGSDEVRTMMSFTSRAFD